MTSTGIELEKLEERRERGESRREEGGEERGEERGEKRGEIQEEKNVTRDKKCFFSKFWFLEKKWNATAMRNQGTLLTPTNLRTYLLLILPLLLVTRHSSASRYR